MLTNPADSQRRQQQEGDVIAALPAVPHRVLAVTWCDAAIAPGTPAGDLPNLFEG